MNSENFQYDQVFENYPDAVLILGEKKFLDSNQMCLEMLGYTKTELKKFTVEGGLNKIISTEEKEKYILHKIKNVLKGEKESFNALSKRKDNSIFHAKFSFIPLNLNGEKHTQVIIKDITERVIFEEAIRSSEERFKNFSRVVHNSTVFIHDQIIVDCNEQYINLFELSSKREIIGKNIIDFIKLNNYNKIFKTLGIETTNKVEFKTNTLKGNVLILESTIDTINYQGQDVTVLIFNDVTNRKKAELALEQTTNRYKNLVDNSPNGIFIVTEDKIKYANNRGLSLLGYKYEDDIFDQIFIDLFPEKYKNDLENDFFEIRAGKELPSREIEIYDSNKNSIEINIKVSLTVYNNQPSFQINIQNLTTRGLLIKEQMKSELLGEINKILKHEIEDHKRTQEKLLEVRNFMSDIFESSIDMIVAFNKERYVTEFNTEAQNVFGYSKEEVLKLKAEDFYVSDKDMHRTEKEITKTGRFRGEVDFLTKDKKKITTLVSASWIRDKDGNIGGVMGVLRDITKLKIDQKEAQKERAKLESIFNSTENMMIWTMDDKNRISSMNKNFIEHFVTHYGIEFNIEDSFIKKIKKALNKNQYQRQLDNLSSSFEGKTHQFNLPLLDLDDNEIWMQIFTNPIYVDDKIEEISCLMFDISERKSIEKKIRDSLKEKEVLLKEVHHRVKNNMQVISSILNLQSGFIDDEKTIQILKESQTRIKTMSYIHETLYQNSDFSAIDFTEYLDTLIINLVQSYNTSLVELKIEKDMDKVELVLDNSIPCGLIVNELITNAMKYAYEDHKNPILYVKLKEKNDKIRLSIGDNGIGLPVDFKYEESDSLGIQLVYTLVEQLRGKIEINREKGTEFLITFDKTLS